MIEPRVTAITIQQEGTRATTLSQTALAQTALAQTALAQTVALWTSATQATMHGLTQAGVWAADTAQQFGVLVAVLMGPAVFSAYAFAAWALAFNLGWTDSFIFTSGALSNWIIWMGMAVLVNTAAAILKKHTQAD
jgi:hypothetical protein